MKLIKEVKAIQYLADHESFEKLKLLGNIDYIKLNNRLFIQTSEGPMEIEKGDYIVKGNDNEFYCCTKEDYEN